MHEIDAKAHGISLIHGYTPRKAVHRYRGSILHGTFNSHIGLNQVYIGHVKAGRLRGIVANTPNTIIVLFHLHLTGPETVGPSCSRYGFAVSKRDMGQVARVVEPIEIIAGPIFRDTGLQYTWLLKISEMPEGRRASFTQISEYKP